MQFYVLTLNIRKRKLDYFTFSLYMLRHGIVARTSPGVASQYAPYCKAKTLDRSMLFECLDGILRTCWGKPARRWGERRDTFAIEIYREAEHLDYHPRHNVHAFLPILCNNPTTFFSTSSVVIIWGDIQMNAIAKLFPSRIVLFFR